MKCVDKISSQNSQKSHGIGDFVFTHTYRKNNHTTNVSLTLLDKYGASKPYEAQFGFTTIHRILELQCAVEVTGRRIH